MSAPGAELKTRGDGLALLGTVLPAGLVFLVYALHLMVVPAAKRQFTEFKLLLPWYSELTVRVSDWLGDNWWATLPALAVLAAGNFLLLRWLGRRSGRLPILWMALVSLVLLAIIGITFAGVEVPRMKLREALAR
jgi:type II secretory pathway component PulF